MAMTAPVMTETVPEGQKLAMTAPVLTNVDANKMEFVLPFEYKSLSDLPEPTDPRVKLREVPSQVVAVARFSGWYSDEVAYRMLKDLKNRLKNYNIISDDSQLDSLHWCVAQYHPPFTLPFLRRNEIWIQIDKNSIPPF